MWKDIPDDSLHNLTKEDEEMIKRLTEALKNIMKTILLQFYVMRIINNH